MNTIYSAGVLLIAAMTVGCASGSGSGSGSTRTRTGCALTPADSTLLASGPVYLGCMVDDSARVLNESSVRFDFRPTSMPRPGAEQCYSAEVEFVVDPRGMLEPGTQKLIRATDPVFGDVVVAAVPSLRYQPARKDNVAVRQIVRFKRIAAMVVTVSTGGAPPTPPVGSPRC
jgi:hypothetical protein